MVQGVLPRAPCSFALYSLHPAPCPLHFGKAQSGIVLDPHASNLCRKLYLITIDHYINVCDFIKISLD